MEMNTRLQVEHPVTELVTGLDLVELQLRVAAGEPLPFTQADVELNGHAIEARVYAEDPARGFLPTGGRVLALDEPDTRVDSGIAEGDEVGSSYDPMLAKVIAWGPDRPTALRRLDRALASYTLLGVPSNLAFLRALLAHPDVVSGRLDTGLVERSLDDLVAGDVPEEVLAAAALERTLALESGDPDPWAIPDAWRLSRGPAWTSWIITPSGGAPVEVRVRGRATDAEVLIEGAPPVPASARDEGSSGGAPAGDAGPVSAALSRDGGRLRLTYGGRSTSFAYARDGDTLWLARDGRAWALAEHVRGEQDGGAAAGAGDGVLRSPMPGTVLAVKVAEGDRVAAGQPLVVVEAMKMEHTVTAPVDGVVSRLPVRAGARVALDAVLAEITAQEAQQ
jgi:acetyl-CoA/propionyl-CoA carboxylase biotin carboxyl carrier protein